jgi:hypothetical protein
MSTRLLAIVAASLILTLGCAAPFPVVGTHPVNLVGHRYVSDPVMIGGSPYSYRLMFDDEGMDVSGCNQTGFAKWSVTDGVLYADDWANNWTLTSCPAEQDAQDHWYVSYLAGRPRISVGGDAFTLTSGDKQILFGPAPND